MRDEPRSKLRTPGGKACSVANSVATNPAMVPVDGGQSIVPSVQPMLASGGAAAGEYPLLPGTLPTTWQ
eukprot:2088386-Amphidinium_carterae.1